MPQPVRYLLDEHLSVVIAGGLRRRGTEARTVQELNRDGFEDAAQLEFARDQLWVLASNDPDFLILDSQGVPHAGICWWPEQKYTIGDIIDNLHEYSLKFEMPDFENQLIFL